MEKKYTIILGFVALFSSIAFSPEAGFHSGVSSRGLEIDSGFKREPVDVQNGHHSFTKQPKVVEKPTLKSPLSEQSDSIVVDHTAQKGEPVSTVAVSDVPDHDDVSIEEKIDAQKDLDDAQGDLTTINNPSDQQGAAPIVSSTVAELGLWKKFTNAVTKIFGSLQAKITVHSEELAASQKTADALKSQIDQAKKQGIESNDGTTAGKNLVIAEKQKIQAIDQIIQSTKALDELKRTLVSDVKDSRETLLASTPLVIKVLNNDPVMQSIDAQVLKLMKLKANRDGNLDSTQALQDVKDLPGALNSGDQRIHQVLAVYQEVTQKIATSALTEEQVVSFYEKRYEDAKLNFNQSKAINAHTSNIKETLDLAQLRLNIANVINKKGA